LTPGGAHGIINETEAVDCTAAGQYVSFKKGKMMKSVGKMATFVRSLRSLLTLIFALALLAGGCSSFFAQPGETAAEGNRRHARTLEIDRQGVMHDIDTFLLLDQPSKLTDKRIP